MPDVVARTPPMWWASLMVGADRHVWLLSPFIGVEAKCLADRALRCWDDRGALPFGSYDGYAVGLHYDGGRWGVAQGHNPPVRYVDAIRAGDYRSHWCPDPSTLIAATSERLVARRQSLDTLGFTMPADRVEERCWDVIDRLLPKHERTEAVRGWYRRWLDPSDPIISHDSEWSHLYSREFVSAQGVRWWGADVAEYAKIAAEVALLGPAHPVTVADAAAETIFTGWILRAVESGELRWP
jgi:hypothetical protein